MSYQIAMLNDLVIADYHVPIADPQTLHEFFVVTRVEDEGDFLFVTEAGIAGGAEKEAPDMLQLGNTLIGSLIRVDKVQKTETFIFNRTSPVGTAHPGRFFPGDGLVEMQETKDGFVLRASGRHSHQSNLNPMTGQVEHYPEPVPTPAPRGATWLFDAVQVAWSGTKTS